MTDSSSTERHTDYLVIGAGPAGLQLGFHLAAAGRDYLILEAGKNAGTFYERYPRHGQLISINKVYTGFDDPEVNLRWDWNSLLGDENVPLFKEYSKEYFPPSALMVDYLNDYAKTYDLNIVTEAPVASVEKDDLFRVVDRQGRRYAAKRLIAATGVSQPYIPPIPGIELTENYTEVSVDPEDFVNQQVLILGKGNSAFETADNLIATASVIHVASPSPVKLAWKTHYVGNLRAVNNNFLDTYQLKSQNAVLDCTIKKIEKQGDKYVVSVAYTHADEETENLTYDRVICCTGFQFDASIYGESCRPELAINDRFPAQTSAWESTNIPDLYFAGTIMQMRDFKKFTSGFIHGFRYNVRALHRILESRYEGVQWPSQEVDYDVDGLTNALVTRINRTSGLWQQFKMLCDVYFPATEGSPALHLEELPFDYVMENERTGDREYFVLNLEFGTNQEDPFLVERHPAPDRGSESFFLHPVIRHYRGTELLGEHHIIEDLCTDWTKEEMHLQPLRQFLAKRFTREAALV